jgi:UDP-N-acetylmuramoyl-tripeptide--D-alanyl-D-alanine ligase
MTGKEKIAVVEFGANHRNEIAPLSRMAKPDIGVITNIGYAHIGYFGSLKNTTSAKFEITSGMDKKKGLLLLNGDDSRLVSKSKEIGIPARFYGFSRKCHLQSKGYALLSNHDTVFYIEKQKYALSSFGKHFVYSALPAIYLARNFEISCDVIADVLHTIKPDSLRGGIETIGGMTFIIDCYNANPSSMDHAVNLLKDFAGDRNKCAVIGDMLELGRYNKNLHVQLGKKLAKAGINKVIIVGEFTEYVLQGALQGGMNKKNIFTCPCARDAVNIVKKVFKKGDIVLLKGSRGIKLETILEHFS